MSTPFDPNLPFWTEYWRSTYATPRAWAVKGENLVHAFNAVASASREGSINFDLRDQALMLAGMAIEVQLKAILVGRDSIRALVSGVRPPQEENERGLLGAFYSHRLAPLAAFAGVALSPEETAVADGLTQYIYWRGRYVVPTERRIDDLLPIQHEDGHIGLRDTTIEDARALIEHVIRAVKANLYADTGI